MPHSIGTCGALLSNADGCWKQLQWGESYPERKAELTLEFLIYSIMASRHFLPARPMMRRADTPALMSAAAVF